VPFAIGLSEKKSMLQAIALGVRAASFSTQRRETIASYAYRAEVVLFTKRRSGPRLLLRRNESYDSFTVTMPSRRTLAIAPLLLAAVEWRHTRK
jgi:hypothetical protein